MKDVIETIQRHCDRAIVRRTHDPIKVRFRNELLVTFDENGTADELEAFGKRCERVRALFVAGDPIDDLPDAGKLANLTTDFYREISANKPQVLAVDTAIRLISQFALYKALATTARLRGNIRSAQVYERHADTCYSRLPQDWRW
ncbi:MAG: hypothetical protein ACTS8S_04900 [Giesbergeria sp.]